eukprot:gene4888-6226_t
MALLDLSMSMSKALSVLSRWQYTLSTAPDPNDIEAIQQLARSAKQFEFEYTLARYDIYYKHRFTTSTGPSRAVDPELSLHLNSFLFLLDTAANIMGECEPKMKYANAFEEVQVQSPISTLEPGAPTTPEAGRANISSSSTYRISFWSRQRYWRIVNIKNFVSDYFPSQSHLFTVSDWRTLSPVIKAHIRQSLSVSVSMTIAGVYGIYSDVADPTFAAFTISFICGGAVAGVSIVTSFNRAVGTVMACVLYLLAVRIIVGWSELSAKWFIGVVIVLAQLPATYVRSLPQYGYAGTVFGFTVPILLLQYPALDASAAVQRIVDTIVACVIFVSVELFLLLFHASSEDLLLDSTVKLFGGIEGHLSDFMALFKASLVGASFSPSYFGPVTESSAAVADDPAVKDPKYNPNISNEFNRQKELA